MFIDTVALQKRAHLKPWWNCKGAESPFFMKVIIREQCEKNKFFFRFSSNLAFILVT